ncbi:hypothetical protein [Rhodopseudomonas sp. BR0M22]|uniref:dCTP deaminase domain-containing protein n=1 Tax=Rhodopseudomonas sp. BR0M22 TaxID=2269369 RepID=UPI001FEE3907|nr:hypothetical protein [Rhodopseudomonas sp. BR0M22]NEW92521.1 hypothetical protein [Rhodopseudomonas sp. BR0M22]
MTLLTDLFAPKQEFLVSLRNCHAGCRAVRGVEEGKECAMALLAGGELDPKRFFEGGNPQVQGSSFDLTIGCIFDHEGKKVDGLFTIKPGHMVQVVSAEVLKLSEKHTGHVTYKTTMTRQGIWALTVGIIDPGWNGPVATTLLNFSRVDHTVTSGDAFLRVSIFEHEPVPIAKLRKADPLDIYLKDIQRVAASKFPPTFLDKDEIAEDAGKNVLDRIRKEALVWVGGIALIFTLLQAVVGSFAGARANLTDIELLKAQVRALQNELLRAGGERASAAGLVTRPDDVPRSAWQPSTTEPSHPGGSGAVSTAPAGPKAQKINPPAQP